MELHLDVDHPTYDSLPPVLGNSRKSHSGWRHWRHLSMLATSKYLLDHVTSSFSWGKQQHKIPGRIPLVLDGQSSHFHLTKSPFARGEPQLFVGVKMFFFEGQITIFLPGKIGFFKMTSAFLLGPQQRGLVHQQRLQLKLRKKAP